MQISADQLEQLRAACRALLGPQEAAVIEREAWAGVLGELSRRATGGAGAEVRETPKARRRAPGQARAVPEAPVIVVVDDEPPVADSLAHILHLAGYRARAFYNAQAAREHLEAEPAELVISDVLMPDTNGVEFAIELRRSRPFCEVLLLSGQPVAGQLVADARRAGHKLEMLYKPLHPSELLSRIAEVCPAPTPA